MSEEIKVYVVEFGDRNMYQMQYKDPMTGKKVTRSTGIERTGRKKEYDDAVKAAAKWEAELQEGRYVPKAKLTWQAFRERYEEECLSALAPATLERASVAMNLLEQIVSPSHLRDLTSERVAFFQTKLRARKISEHTIKGHLAHLKAALNWAKRMGLLTVVPSIEMPRRTKGSKVMKGRPITREEFERMLEKIPEALWGKPKENAKPLTPEVAAYRLQVVQSWKRFLEGLWWSGLRLAESLELTWDGHSLRIDLSGDFPMLAIPEGADKSGLGQLLPLAPEFCDFLLATPLAERTGPVFNPLPRAKWPRPMSAHHIGRTITEMGRLAGVKVHTSPDGKRVKFASAHDLRRSFGTRWAKRVMPIVLQKLMRHSNVQTTTKYYAEMDAADVARSLRDALLANSLANTRPAAENGDAPRNDATLESQRSSEGCS